MPVLTSNDFLFPLSSLSQWYSDRNDDYGNNHKISMKEYIHVDTIRIVLLYLF